MRPIIILLVAMLSPVANASEADQATKAWMCLFKQMPITVLSPESTIPNAVLNIEVRNNLDFKVAALAVDMSLANATGRAEQSSVIPLPSNLEPGETRRLTIHLSLDEKQRSKLRGRVSARVAAANILDDKKHRLVVREALGPAYRVFWPTIKQSSRACKP